VGSIGFPSLTSVSLRKKEVNLEVCNHFSVTETIVNGTVVCINCCLIALLKAIIEIELKVHGKSPSNIRLVFGGDGHRVASKLKRV